MPITRPSASKPTPGKPAGGINRLVPTGGSIVARARAEAKRQREEADKRRTGATRFWVPREETEGREMVILDKSLEDGFQMWEHKLQDSDGKWNRTEPCTKAFGECPLCKHTERKPTLMTFISVLDLKPYTPKGASEPVPYTRRLLAIGANQLEAFFRLEQAANAEGKNLRGMYLLMARDGGDKSPAIGTPIPQVKVKGAPTYQLMSEEELVAEFGHEARKNKEGKVYAKANEFLKPFNYTELFPEPGDDDIAALEAEFGGGGGAKGGKKTPAQQFDDSDESDAPPVATKRVAATKTASKVAAKKGAKAAPEPEPEEEDVESLGAVADDESDEGCEAAQERLTALAEEKGIDPNDYATWVELAEALTDQIPMGDEPEVDAAAKEQVETWADYGVLVDEEKDDGTAEEALTKAAKEAGIDPDEYATWAEVGEYLDSLAGDAAADAPEGEAEVLDYTEVGEAADGGDADAEATLREAAESFGLDPTDGELYPSWADLAAAINEAQEPGEAEEQEEAGAEVHPLILAGEAADSEDGDPKAEVKLEKAAKMADLDPNDFATWGELADALVAAEEDAASAAATSKGPKGGRKDPFRSR